MPHLKQVAVQDLWIKGDILLGTNDVLYVGLEVQWGEGDAASQANS